MDIPSRWQQHVTQMRAGKHANPPLQRAFAKYGEPALQFDILLFCAPKDLLFYEQRAIDVLNPEYNVCRVAGNSLGVKRSQEARKKMSAAGTGRKRSPETAEKMRRILTGRKLSEASKEKIRAQRWHHTPEQVERMRARRASEESRRKMSESHKGKPGPWAGKSRPEETRRKISETLKARETPPFWLHRKNLKTKNAQ